MNEATEIFQGDYTFPNGRSPVFNNELEFETLFYLVIQSTIESDAMRIHGKKAPAIINIEFMIDNLEYELYLPTDFKYTGSCAREKSLPEKIAHYNIETHKEYYQKELSKIKEHFLHKTSNIHLEHLVDNIFENLPIRIIGNNKETIFDDETARKICRKIQTPHIRALLEYPKSKIIELHEIAMDCFKRYGGHILTFLIKLPILEFGAKNVTVKRLFVNNKGLIPAYRFKCGNNSCIIKFYEKKKSDPINFKSVVLTDANTKIEIGKITYNGNITHREARSSPITLFRNNFNNGQLHCEVALGNCLNPSCNHPLTDPLSLIAGYGKKCAENLGIPY